MKVLTTAIVADLRNKLNGTVFAKNRYGLYARTKVTPVNPRTTRQQQNRAVLGSNSSAWRGLTQNQRDAWIAAAPNFPVQDIFGNTHFLSGQALFVSLNNNLKNAGKSPLTLPPTPAAMPSATLLSVAAAAGSPALTAAFDIAATPSGYSVMFKATPNIIPSKLFVKNRLRNIGVVAVSASSANLLTAWQAQFGTLIEGQRISVEAFLINETTGQASTPSQATAIVAA